MKMWNLSISFIVSYLWNILSITFQLHRVQIPEEVTRQRLSRRSIAFFADADEDVIIEPLDGSNKYPPISARDYWKMKFAVTQPGS